MVSLTKEEILYSMNSVSLAIGNATTYPDTPLGMSTDASRNVFNYSDSKTNFDYQIYGTMVELRIFSYLEDYYLDLIKDSDIDFGNIKQKIFINQQDSNKFSNKQIIKYIRNAVAHSDEDKELFKISRNGRFVEIDLKDTSPIPFHVKIDSNDLLTMISVLMDLTKNKYCTYIDRDCYKVYRIYYKKEIDTKVIFGDRDSSNYIYDYDEAYQTLIDYFKNNNIDYEVKEYTLTKEQSDLIRKYKKESKKINNEEVSDMFFTEYVSSLIPLGPEKIYSLMNHLHILSMVTRFPEYSFNKLSDCISSAYLGDDVPDEFSSQYGYLFTDNSAKTNLRLITNDYFMRNQIATEILTYYFSCYNDDDVIEVDGRKIDKVNLRDALVHGRWFDDYDENIVCCDTRNGKNNDYNFYWTTKVNLAELFKYYKKDFLKEDFNSFRK